MVVSRNGLLLFPMNEDHSDHPVFLELKKLSLGAVRFPYGFFVGQEPGTKYVIPATPDERAVILLKAFPDLTDEQARFGGCTPDDMGPGCHGGCPGFPSGYECVRIHEERVRYHGCACIDMS